MTAMRRLDLRQHHHVRAGLGLRCDLALGRQAPAWRRRIARGSIRRRSGVRQQPSRGNAGVHRTLSHALRGSAHAARPEMPPLPAAGPVGCGRFRLRLVGQINHLRHSRPVFPVGAFQRPRSSSALSRHGGALRSWKVGAKVPIWWGGRGRANAPARQACCMTTHRLSKRKFGRENPKPCARYLWIAVSTVYVSGCNFSESTGKLSYHVASRIYVDASRPATKSWRRIYYKLFSADLFASLRQPPNRHAARASCLRGLRVPEPLRDILSKEMSTVFGIHTPLIFAYDRSRSSSRDAPNCQGNEAGARECIGLFHGRRVWVYKRARHLWHSLGQFLRQCDKRRES